MLTTRFGRVYMWMKRARIGQLVAYRTNNLYLRQGSTNDKVSHVLMLCANVAFYLALDMAQTAWEVL